ncbi:hypothetical protein L3Q82_005242 [Scortum barcoo]|uniref:Uncharacterized protein n=1 Tax=Scortum barcoo TaxID=214431 RepID=A0ACB8V9S0_9TELE|nr:hypothetical protein L3Q82_005242 [Scortum barcoo]
MSADDFQTKYASVMESMLKSAVAETTKLFETMVDELKAEISRIKQENEVLKKRCKQFESERSRPAADPGDGEPLLGCGRRDTAVQCDLVPLRTGLVEQCQPLRYLSLNNQEQQCGDEEIKYALQESNCDAHSQMDFILVKHEEEEVYPTKVCRQLLSDKAGSTLASVCRIENEGDFIHQDCSTGEIPLLQKDEETRQAVELLQGPQTQSPEREHSIVISLAAINEDKEEPSEVSQNISEIGTQGEHITSQKQPLMVALHQSDVEPLEKMQPSVVPQQTDVTLQQNPDVRSTEEKLAQPTPLNEGEACDKFRVSMAGGEAGYRPEISVPLRRGRPPKKRKYLQQPVKEILHSPPSDIPAEQEVKNSPAIRMEEADISSVLDTVTITSPESPQASLLQPEESLSIIMSSAQKRANTALEDKENSKVSSNDSVDAEASCAETSTSDKKTLQKSSICYN